ncbi:MAG: ABC transporter ATP-binding protein/permease, partial [Odoribacteraceae bacterium]|nr:ABC transporter ATP-binding protein/permease [Odoribacteraceae bacterium]
RHVHFRHAGSAADVLRDISFHVPAGSTVAIAGATGSGKSTLVHLIPRLHEATAGEILLDGININEYDREDLRAGVLIVLQDDELFTGTILENLRWGNPDASRQEIEQAAADALAHDFITAMPDGYDTLLGRGGANVSGGQKQRLCIARALLGNPRVLVLDDSLSAVDATTEREIRRRLSARLATTTLVIITQRAGATRDVDRVIVLDNGTVSDIDAPAALLQKPGIYRDIHDTLQQTF